MSFVSTCFLLEKIPIQWLSELWAHAEIKNPGVCVKKVKTYYQVIESEEEHNTKKNVPKLSSSLKVGCWAKESPPQHSSYIKQQFFFLLLFSSNSFLSYFLFRCEETKRVCIDRKEREKIERDWKKSESEFNSQCIFPRRMNRCRRSIQHTHVRNSRVELIETDGWKKYDQPIQFVSECRSKLRNKKKLITRTSDEGTKKKPTMKRSINHRR